MSLQYGEVSLKILSLDEISLILLLMLRDTYVIRFDHIVKLVNELPSSKRSILKIIAKVFDPLGVLTLFSLR